MHATRFDALVRTLGTTRRGTLRLLSAGALSGMLALLGRGETAAGCKPVGKPCTSSGQCCPGARCKHGTCRCKSLSFRCGSKCCLDGAGCGLLLGSLVCHNGSKQPGDPCDPALPGQCNSGKCRCVNVDVPSTCTCRETVCKASQGTCVNGPGDCCHGGCTDASLECGGGDRCCVGGGKSCTEDCDCCEAPDILRCRDGKCCIPQTADGNCGSDADCCGTLVCDPENLCVHP